MFDLEQLLTIGPGRASGRTDGSNPSDDARIAVLEGADVRFVSFSPDGTRLATVSERGLSRSGTRGTVT